ncbi:MAG: OmpH/Skp family outer membrane protein [Planctomycetota bacterium]|jgi:Skp family chaperone for outer membrane proteins
MRKLTIPCVALLAVALLAPPTLAQSPLKVAVFDPQRVSEETIDGKRLQAELKAVSDRKQQELTAMEDEIKGLQQQLQQQALSLSVEKRTALELTIQRKLLALNNSQDLANRELQLEVQAAEGIFNEKLRAVLDDYGANESFDLILDRGSVAYAGAKIDVTTAIIDAFNKMFPAAGGE